VIILRVRELLYGLRHLLDGRLFFDYALDLCDSLLLLSVRVAETLDYTSFMPLELPGFMLLLIYKLDLLLDGLVLLPLHLDRILSNQLFFRKDYSRLECIYLVASVLHYFKLTFLETCGQFQKTLSLLLDLDSLCCFNG
jgi:hypothetical protein